MSSDHNGAVGSQERVRVLVADDDPAFAEVLRTTFAHDDRFEVVGEAHDGEQAVALAKELAPDVVALDLVMPRMDGIEATKQIRAGRPECRVVLVSGSIFQERVGKGAEVARSAGASAYVLKSRAIVELADTVHAVAHAPTSSDFVVLGPDGITAVLDEQSFRSYRA
jgi:DNA-binding NarL/FixJ family response regulator